MNNSVNVLWISILPTWRTSGPKSWAQGELSNDHLTFVERIHTAKGELVKQVFKYSYWRKCYMKIQHCMNDNMYKKHLMTTCTHSIEWLHVQTALNIDMYKAHWFATCTCINSIKWLHLQWTLNNYIFTYHVMTICWDIIE